MALLCYNKGCGQKFDSDDNDHGSDCCLFHSGVPIFHDALKGWSCCRKRTTDFSEFLSIKGCTRGRHSSVKPEEPLRPEVTSDKIDIKTPSDPEILYQGPKSAETLQRERPSKDEPLTKLPHKVSASLIQLLDKLDISQRAETDKRESQAVVAGTRCKNSGCKTVYEGPETDAGVCTHHPGAPVFHEGYKYWSCCCIRTTDFNSFLDQKGCSTDKHRWLPKQDKKKVACRHDWHQTGNNVVVTIYSKNANPELSSVKANQTLLSVQIHFENNKLFKRDFHLWGVVDVKQSSVNLVPSKLEVTLRKADRLSWGKLEDPNYKPRPAPPENSFSEEEAPPAPPAWDIEDDDISDSDEEWAYDTSENRDRKEERKKEREKKAEEEVKAKRKEVEEEMKKAMEARRKEEEELKKRQEDNEGFEDMPELEDDE